MGYSRQWQRLLLCEGDMPARVKGAAGRADQQKQLILLWMHSNDLNLIGVKTIHKHKDTHMRMHEHVCVRCIGHKEACSQNPDRPVPAQEMTRCVLLTLSNQANDAASHRLHSHDLFLLGRRLEWVRWVGFGARPLPPADDKECQCHACWECSWDMPRKLDS